MQPHCIPERQEKGIRCCLNKQEMKPHCKLEHRKGAKGIREESQAPMITIPSVNSNDQHYARAECIKNEAYC